MKRIYTTFFVLLNFLLCAQNTPTSFDRIYLNVEDFQFDQIKDVQIENFQFVNPTLNLDNGMYIFQVKPFEFVPKKGVKTNKKIQHILSMHSKEIRICSLMIYLIRKKKILHE